MRQPGVGRDLHRTREEVFHGQRHRGHRTGKGKWGPAPAWKSGAIVSATVTPEQPATSGKSRKSQQQNEADGDADGERRDIARHRQRHHRQHEADHDALACRQPGRPARGKAQTEGQAACNQR